MLKRNGTITSAQSLVIAPCSGFLKKESAHSVMLGSASSSSVNKDDARVTQGAIVSNKLLAGALQQIKEQQAVRDADKLRRLRTHRERQLQLKRTAG